MPESRTVLLNGSEIIPSKIICIGRNYPEHALELGNPLPDEMVVFMKPNSAIAGTLTAGFAEEIHYEGEICFMVIDGIFAAAAFGLDLTKRRLQAELKKKGLPWERSKAFDGSALFSPFVNIDTNPDSLELDLKINGSTAQHDSVSSMLFKPGVMLEELRSFLTLNDGDIVMTGTPRGVGPVKKGDLLTGSVSIRNRILSSASWQAL